MADDLGAFSTPGDADIPGAESLYRVDGPHALIFGRVEGGASDWLAFVEPPIEADVTEFRFVLRDDSYESGFRTSAPFDVSESPADVAGRLGLGDAVVRVVFGRAE